MDKRPVDRESSGPKFTRLLKQTSIIASLWMISLLGGSGAHAEVPGQVTVVAPRGEIEASTPNFQWRRVDDATWYRLYISHSGGVVLDKWYALAELDCGSRCTIDAPVSLASGNYRWWVLAWNADGPGPWSEPATLTVLEPPPLGTATLSSPRELIDTRSPTFQWSVVADATWYRLVVNTSTGRSVIDKWVRSDEAQCASSGPCSIASPAQLAPGHYRWWILAWNPQQQGSWSGAGSFEVDSGKPRAVTLNAPSDITISDAPTFLWSKESRATYYQLLVHDQSDQSVVDQWFTDSEVNCDGNSASANCTVTLESSLADGSYHWWIRTWNGNGYGPWSAAANFSVRGPVSDINAIPGQTSLSSPSGTVVDRAPTFSWNEVARASWYQLWVNSTSRARCGRDGTEQRKRIAMGKRAPLRRR